jgi:3-dehydroquinate dehydratase-2
MVKTGMMKKKTTSSKRSMTIAVINGPNINILGIREPDFYGKETWNDIEMRLNDSSNQLDVALIFFQSNHEGYIVDFIQDNLGVIDGIVINPAAYTKTGYAILDAITATGIPFVEVHLSNIFKREGWHSESIFADKAIGHVIGFKGYVYDLGLMAIHNFIIKINNKSVTTFKEENRYE